MNIERPASNDELITDDRRLMNVGHRTLNVE